MRERAVLKNKAALAIILCLISFCMPSCRQEKKDPYRQPAMELYKSSLELIKNFTDSVRNTKDSASLNRLNAGYEELITRLNMRYPSEVGLHISESENDTLTNLIEKYIFLRDSLLLEFSKNKFINDSVAADSVKVYKKPISNGTVVTTAVSIQTSTDRNPEI